MILAGGTGGVYKLDQVADDDLDSIPDALEQNAPNNGDANQDGVLDESQADVASLPIAPGATDADGGYVTVEIMGDNETHCQQLMNVQSLSSANLPIDVGHEYPFGLLRFEIRDCPQAAVNITYHDHADSGFAGEWRFRTFAPDTPSNERSFAWRSFEGNAQADGVVWELSLVEGEFGDQGPQTGRIVFQGGVARELDGAVFRDRFE